MYPIKQSTTAQPLVFLLISSTDHLSAKTGASPTVTLSKAGAAFGSPSGAVTEIANGWYQVAGNATDTNTLGPLMLHATASGADNTDVCYHVVAYDPQTADLAISAVQLTEAYAALHTAPTWAQILFEIRGHMAEKSVSGTTLTTKKIDGSTTAETFTLNDATSPTSITRAS